MTLKRPSKKLAILLLAIVIVSLASILAFKMANSHNAKSSATTSSETTVNTVNYDPPTKEEVIAGDEQKDKNVQRDKVNSNTAPPAGSANIVIVDAGQYDNTIEIRSFISNVYEDGGTCTVTFTKDSLSVSRANTAFKDATTTQCKPINIGRSEFPAAGDWKLVVSYTSPTISGSSTTKTVSIK